MEIFRNTLPVVKFEHPSPGNTAVTSVSWAIGDTSGTASPVAGSGYTTAALPFQQYDGQMAVTWNFIITSSGSYSITQYYDVVTPLISISQVSSIVDDEEWTNDDYIGLESNVRNIIQSHTGQKFGMFSGTKTVYGQGQSSLSLPERLIDLTSITGYPYPSLLLIRGDGWYLETKDIGIPEVRADFDGFNLAEVPIVAPYSQSLRNFNQNQAYNITGKWGWNSVPQGVYEAAKLLVNDYAGDTLYRDRYLVSMTAADWRIQFTNGAFAKTGNVRADQLLSPYVLKRGWAVL